MAVKPVRTQAKQVAAYINGVPTRRVQSFDWASNFTTDDVFELGNAGVVESSVTLVESSVTVNSNEWGTTDLEAMIFGIYEQRNCVGDNAGNSWANTIATIYIATTGAGGGWGATATAGDYLQVIRVNSTATTNDTEYVVISAVDAPDGNGAQAITLASGNRLTAACATSDMVCLVNKYTIDQDTVDSNPVHLILPHRYSNTATTIMHSVILPRCFVDNLTYNFDTGGASEQNYTMVGEEERLVLGNWKETVSTTGSFMSYNNTTGSLTFRVPLNSRACLATPYAVYADSNLVTWTGAPGGTINHSSGAVTVHAYIGGGLSITSAAQLIYYAAIPTAHRVGFKGLTNIDSSIGKLTKGFVDVYLGLSSGGTGSEKLLRCTGINVSIPLTRESIDELGESRSISKPLEGNLRNEVTVTFNRNDLREYAKLLGSEAAFDAGTLKEILMTSLKDVKTGVITVYFYASQTTHDATTLLKTMTFTNCNFIGDNSTTPISGASSVELTFSTQSVDIVGSGLAPVYV